MAIPEYISIPLTREQVAIVDYDDRDLLERTWQASKRQTIREQYTAVWFEYLGNRKWKCHQMHRIIVERVIGRSLQRKELVDHINGNSIDNRRVNLRIASQSENLMNRGKTSINSSGYKGVNKHEGMWRASIKAGGKQKHLGYFATAKEAHAAYCEAAKELHGEFARGEWE